MPSEVLKKLDLPKRTLCQDLLAEDIGDFLDGNSFLSLCICCGTVIVPCCQQLSFGRAGLALEILSEFDLPNNSISTLAELLCDHISLINDEVLVENLEGLPSLK